LVRISITEILKLLYGAVNVFYIFLKSRPVCVLFWLWFKYLYRVSIKFFLDYKHLLQENYVEYKHVTVT